MKMISQSLFILASLFILTACGGEKESFGPGKEVTPITILPETPTSMVLLSNASPSSNPNPQVRVQGIGYGVEIYTNRECLGLPLAVSLVSTFILPPLRPGQYEFFARSLTGSGARSACSGKLMEYRSLLKLPMSFAYQAGQLPENIRKLEVADLDSDGIDDYVFATDTMSGISFGTTDSSRELKVFEMAQTATAIKITDMDGDKLKDVLLGDDQKNLHFFRNDGGRIFLYAGHDEVNGPKDAIDQIDCQDFNDDRVKDTLVHTKGGAFLVKLSQLDGSFTEFMQVLVDANITDYQLVDMNQDKLMDVVSRHGHQFKVYLNILGTFPLSNTIETSLKKGEFLFADINLDGEKDLITLYQRELKVKVSDGHGGFHLEKISTGVYALAASELKARDVDGDSKVDLLLYDQVLRVLTIFRGQGDGTFSTPIMYPILPGFPFDVLDLNQDGKKDILAQQSLFQL